MLLFLKPSSTNMGNWAAKEPPSLAPLPTDRQAGVLQPKCPCLAPDAAQATYASNRYNSEAK